MKKILLVFTLLFLCSCFSQKTEDEGKSIKINETDNQIELSPQKIEIRADDGLDI